MDLLDQLRVFLRVAHGGGFSAAAEQLDMPRPTVSLAVQRLEARLGARLFSRTTPVRCGTSAATANLRPSCSAPSSG